MAVVVDFSNKATDLRKRVTSMAWRLVKSVNLSFSEAMKKAWLLSKEAQLYTINFLGSLASLRAQVTEYGYYSAKIKFEAIKKELMTLGKIAGELFNSTQNLDAKMAYEIILSIKEALKQGGQPTEKQLRTVFLICKKINIL
jgi:hypothetical protein